MSTDQTEGRVGEMVNDLIGEALAAGRNVGMSRRGAGSSELDAAKDDLLTEIDRLRAERDELRAEATAAVHALRSYQHGNSSPELAESVADALGRALNQTEGE